MDQMKYLHFGPKITFDSDIYWFIKDYRHGQFMVTVLMDFYLNESTGWYLYM